MHLCKMQPFLIKLTINTVTSMEIKGVNDTVTGMETKDVNNTVSTDD